MTATAREWLQALAEELQALDHRMAGHRAPHRAGLRVMKAVSGGAAGRDWSPDCHRPRRGRWRCDGFKNGRQFAAWLGLVPRQPSTGGKTTLLGITKGGNCSLRTCSSMVPVRSSGWWIAKQMPGVAGSKGCKQTGDDCASVAQANKTARVAWVLLARGERYRPPACPGMAA